MQHKIINKICPANLLATVLIVIAMLVGCSTDQVTGPELATGKPAILRAIDASLLSVVVRLEESGLEFIGQQREDDSWYVQMEVASGQTHAFVASWYAYTKGQRVLVLEQRGEFFAGPTRVQSDAETVDVSDGNGFDADCDGMSNLAEIEDNSDPLSIPGCNGDTQTTVAEISADDNAADDGATDTNGSGSSDGSSDSNGTTSGADNSGETAAPVVSATLPELQPIPAGCFQMGSPLSDLYRRVDERQHEVCVEAFQIGQYEVTFDQYSEFAGQPGAVQTIPFDSNWGMGSRPIINVSWRNAVLYTQWLSELTGDTYRLPTEAEWEYAARGDTQTSFWTGDMLRDDHENFNSSDTWGGGVATGVPVPNTTLPVGSLEPNQYGLYDMLGNVIEFTCSAYSDNYENKLEEQCDYDMTQEHVVRGAAYNYIASWARSSTRTGQVLPDEINGHIGFRVVRVNP